MDNSTSTSATTSTNTNTDTNNTSTEEPTESPDHLNMKVKSQDGNEVFFKVKKTTQFSKIFGAYCKKVGADQASVRFLFDGNRVRDDQTPEQLGMENDDIIDAMVQQTGGTM